MPDKPRELSLYATERYLTSDARLRRYSLRLDGFVSMRAPLSGGEFVTKPLRFDGDDLTLNFSTSAAGSIRLELQNPSGQPYQGFLLSKSPELFGDDLQRVVQWPNGADVVNSRGARSDSDSFCPTPTFTRFSSAPSTAKSRHEGRPNLEVFDRITRCIFTDPSTPVRTQLPANATVLTGCFMPVCLVYKHMPENEAVTFSSERTVEIEDRPMPEPDADEVRIETERTLISVGSELAMLTGTHQPENLPTDGFPMDPGYSNVGTIIDVGENVDDDLIGECVGSPTIHAQYVTAEASEIVPVPDGISSVSATFYQIAAIAMNAVRRGEVDWGETVAVRGLGLVGQLALRTSVVAGASSVYALDLDAGRLEATPDHARVEPVHVGNVDGDTPGEEFADVVVDATGNPETLDGGLSLIREDGRFVVVGCPRRTVEFDFYRSCIVPSAHIIGSYRIPAGGQGRWDRRAYADLFFEYLQSGDVDVESLVTSEPDAADAPAVFDALLDEPTSELGVVFDWS